jgi:hypothetical protein
MLDNAAKGMTSVDRFMRGFVAGVAGGLAMQLWSFISYHLLGITMLRFLDWAAILIFGDHVANTAEAVTAFFIHLVFTGMLGIVFAFLIPQVTSRAYLLKGVIYALIVGFFIYVIPVLLQMPLLRETALGTSLSNQIGGVIWGLVTAYTLARLSRRELT